ncbi:hypothetical protein A5781_06110 [Mycobacterium sp. 852002-30065_SCH5024008]|nr:hypothetical protein A5781_06110 [Mycobacterium sp. 852002-30065_SCH5024008]
MRVEHFKVLVSTDPGMESVLGLLAQTKTQEVLIPLTYKAAKEMSDLVARVLILEAPEMYFPADVATKLKDGELTLEQVKKLI